MLQLGKSDSPKMLLDDQRTLVECVLYILNKAGATDIYHLMKELYYAERYHLATYGSRMVYDVFYALDFGPVPSGLYDALKNKSNKHCPELLGMISESVKRAEYDASDILIPLRKPDMDWLSESMTESLEHAVREVGNLSFKQLLNKSHDSIWRKAFDAGKKPISYIDMARAEGASEDMIAYLQDSEELIQFLGR